MFQPIALSALVLPRGVESALVVTFASQVDWGADQLLEFWLGGQGPTCMFTAYTMDLMSIGQVSVRPSAAKGSHFGPNLQAAVFNTSSRRVLLWT